VPHEENPLRKELDLEEAFIILYSGNLGVSHFFDDLIEVMRRLKARDDIRFVFIGDGARRSQVHRAQTQYALDNILLLPYQPLEQLAVSLSLGDVHFVSLRNGFEGLVVPSKAYGAMAVGRPILYQGSAAGEIARMVTEHDIGAVIAEGAIERLEETILAYSHNPGLVAEQGERALALAKSSYSTMRALEKYKELLIEEQWAQPGVTMRGY
jgi:glycosyltransferase involved in cell wall biosynthesis